MHSRSVDAARSPASRTGLRPAAAAIGLPLLSLCLLWALRPASAAEPDATASPPQVLPLTARWCLAASQGEPACILLEQPRSQRQYMMGLQLRPPLPALRGMWFGFDPPQPARFWMHRTIAPLDMLFVSEGRVIAIEAGAPPCPHLPCRSYGPGVPVQGVLELCAGEAARLGITVGTPVRIEPLP